MQLFCTITASNGQRVPLTINDKETTKMTPTQLRTQVSTVTKIPITELRLIFRGRMIKDDDTLEHSVLTEYKLENESVLHCMGKPVVAVAVVDSSSSDNNTVSGTTTSTSSSSAGATVDSNRTVVPPLSRPMGSRSSAASIPRSLPIMNPNGDVSSNVHNLDNDPLKKALVRLRQNNPPSIYATGVTTLEKVLMNIIDHPMEEKYRQVKKQNAAFNKRLGGLIGGHDCMLATGFTVENNDTTSGEEVYKLQATAQKWTYLTEKAQQIVIDASQQAKLQQQQAQQPSSSSLPVGVGVGGVPAGGGNGGTGGMMPGLPGGMNMNMNDPNMQNMMSQMMQNPEALATALQNPMIQQMMQNDPNISPMMRQQMEAMSNNPAMLQQMTQRMQDPTVQAQLRQAMAANGGGGGANGGGPLGGGMGGMMPNNSNNDAGAAAPPAQQQQLQPPRNDTNQTEDDMIAEAIRRSLEDAS